MKEVHLVGCPNCGDVRMFKPGDRRLSGLCKQCLSADLVPIAIDFEKHTFVIPA